MIKKNPVQFTDTTLRDGHQSTLATRFRLDDMLQLIEKMDQLGFWSMEVWGGATFDVTHRFLGEDPWERIRTLKKNLKNTPTMMLLRGQNLVGYRHYSDDVVDTFVKHASECGVDIFRIFDALNDLRNFEASVRAIQDLKRDRVPVHFQATVCYSLTERRMGGEVYHLNYYLDFAKKTVEMGADSFCIKDMAGLLSPFDAYQLVKALKEAISIPVELHTHYTSGQGSMSCLKAIEAGVDILDTALSPFALRTSQPAIEPLLVSILNSPRESPIDIAKTIEIGLDLEKLAIKYRDFLDTSKMSVVDTGVLLHQIPGGMYSNLVSQLKEANSLDRIQEVITELPKVRKELGYPPLVTPTSQIVGIQSVLNVLFGRYQTVSAETKDLVYGLYGRTPAPIDPKIQGQILKGYSKGETPITCRAADTLPPELEKAKAATQGLAKGIGDVLIYALYPTTGQRYLRWKYGLEPMPAEIRGKSLDQIKLEDEVISTIKKKNLFQEISPYIQKLSEPQGEKKAGLRSYTVYVNGERYQVEVEGNRKAERVVPQWLTPSIPKANNPPPAIQGTNPTTLPSEPVSPDSTVLRAVMPGILIRYLVAEGDRVNAGQPVCIVEAMKMQNTLSAPAAGKIKMLHCKPGASIAKNAILLSIAKD